MMPVGKDLIINGDLALNGGLAVSGDLVSLVARDSGEETLGGGVVSGIIAARCRD